MKKHGYVITGLCSIYLLSFTGCAIDEAPEGDVLELTIMDEGVAEEAAADGPVTTASPPCSGAECNGLNPATTGCGNPANGSVYTQQSATIMSGGLAVGGVELRYSQWCNARWSRTISYIGNRCIGAVMRHSSNGYDLAGTNTYLCDHSDVYGNMHGNVARAKGYLYTEPQNTFSYREAVTAAQ
jgi:hypothetical protein